LIGFVAYFLIQKTNFTKFITGKNINIFCIILAAVIITPALISYYYTVPPKEVTNWWKCDEGQEICNEISEMIIIYDKTYSWKEGSFRRGNQDIPGYKFIWDYDKSLKEITLTQREMSEIHAPKLDGWTLTLRLDIDTTERNHYTMTTYYVSDTNFTLFNAKLFNGVTWSGRWSE